MIDARDFVVAERERLREELEAVDETPIEDENAESKEEEFPDIPPERRRRRGQSGLEEWY